MTNAQNGLKNSQAHATSYHRLLEYGATLLLCGVIINQVSVPMLKICAATVTAISISTTAFAETCGNDASGFSQWKQQFASEAAAKGVGQRGLQALANTSYATRTISADRNQKSFRYSLEDFMRIRGADTIVAQGKRRISRDRAFYASLEAAYGVPAAVIVAIHGMETGFGNFMGDANVVSAISTLAYDCRRSDFSAATPWQHCSLLTAVAYRQTPSARCTAKWDTLSSCPAMSCASA